MSDLVYPVLLDTDPEQLVEDEFKNRHNQLFCWRMLRMVAAVDQNTFKATKDEHKDQPARSFEIYEGNIEEQARALCKQFMKKEILESLPADADESKDDIEMDAEPA